MVEEPRSLVLLLLEPQGTETLGHALLDVVGAEAFLQAEVTPIELDHGPVGHRPAERRARGLELEIVRPVQGAEELVEQAGLPDPGVAGEENDTAPPRGGFVEDRGQSLALGDATDERREAPLERD